jgi:hypothetical protein
VFLEEGISLARPALAVPGNKFTRLSFCTLDEAVLEKSCRPSFASQIPREDSLMHGHSTLQIKNQTTPVLPLDSAIAHISVICDES